MSSAGEESCCSSSNDSLSTATTSINEPNTETTTSNDCNLELFNTDINTNDSGCSSSSTTTPPKGPSAASETTFNKPPEDHSTGKLLCIETRALSEASSTSTESPEDSSIPTLRFPQKLWRIVNECKSGAISWGPGGYTVFVDEHKFTAEFLVCDEPLFKTRIFSSFVRQLNLYGFRKVTTSRGRQHNGTGPSCEFLHEHFRSGRLDLLSRVCRKTCSKRSDRQKKRRIPAPYVDPVTGLTKLEMCQMALTEALEQATKQYKEELLELRKKSGNIVKDGEKSQTKTEAEHNIKIVIGDMVQIVNVEDLPIIDASVIPIITNSNGSEYQSQWGQIYTLTTESVITPVPQ